MTERLHFHFSLSCIGEGNGNPLQCSCLENPRDRRAWWAAVYGVTQSRTRLKRLSSSSKFFKNSKRKKRLLFMEHLCAFHLAPQPLQKKAKRQKSPVWCYPWLVRVCIQIQTSPSPLSPTLSLLWPKPRVY